MTYSSRTGRSRPSSSTPKAVSSGISSKRVKVPGNYPLSSTLGLPRTGCTLGATRRRSLSLTMKVTWSGNSLSAALSSAAGSSWPIRRTFYCMGPAGPTHPAARASIDIPWDIIAIEPDGTSQNTIGSFPIPSFYRSRRRGRDQWNELEPASSCRSQWQFSVPEFFA